MIITGKTSTATREASPVLSIESGRQTLYRLLSQADVFDRTFGLAGKVPGRYVRLHKQFPRLIYGPPHRVWKRGSLDKNNPAYDTISYWTWAGIGSLIFKTRRNPPVGGAAVGVWQGWG